MTPLCHMGGAIPVQALPPQAGVFPYPESATTMWVSSGRAAFDCILRSLPTEPQQVWVPRFICNTVLEPLARLRIPVKRYEVDAQMHPILPARLGTEDAVLLVNYFGLTGGAVARAAAQAPCPVVVDATTAFYCPPLPHVPTFYSPRKFAGLADGGIAVGVKAGAFHLPADEGSDTRTAALLRTPSDAAVQAAEDALSSLPRKMGQLTRQLMSSTAWQAAAAQRLSNYAVLHRVLGHINRLSLPATPAYAPMCYPLVCGIPALRDSLIDAGVRLPLFWPEVIETTSADTTENRLARTLLPLPIDQRYTERDMQQLIKLIL